jgi:hypothetical protein
MKKTITLALLILLAFAKANAQQYTPFPDSNAEWHVYYLGSCTDGAPLDTAIINYSINGDTSINGTTFHKLKTTYDNDTTDTPFGVIAIREVNKKIYGFSANGMLPDTLIYDFNAQKGDSVSVAYRKEKVNNVDSVQTGTSYSRRLTLEESGYGNGALEYWIEGIGSTVGPFTNTIPLPTCGVHIYELICYKQNGVVKYLSPNFESCDATRPKTVTAISETGYHSSLKIYPNPTVSNQLRIENVDTYQGYVAKVTDYTGKVILSQNLNRSNNIIKLPNTGLFYVLMITNKQGQMIESRKILNQ